MNIDFYKNIVVKYPEEFKLFRDKIFPIVMKWEGGGKLHNVAGDSGGWTIWGIAFNYWKSIFKNFDDFKDTTMEEASYIAFVKFYLAIRATRCLMIQNYIILIWHIIWEQIEP